MTRVWRVSRLVAPMLAVCALLGGCGRAEGGTNTVRVLFDGTVMMLDVAADLEATSRAGGGVRLARADAMQRRAVYEITLSRVDGASPIPLRRTRDGGLIRYGVDRSEGGSGGPEVTLIAERRCGAVNVRLRFEVQAEAVGDTDLDPVLDMLANARCT